jgi:heptosyltransferase-2
VTVVERIVVFQPAFLGDVVFASPLTAGLGGAWPNAELAFVARPPGSSIAAFLPGVTRVFSYDKRGVDRGAAGVFRVVRKLRAFAPDVFVSVHGSLRSGLIARLSGAKVRLGPAGQPGSFGFNDRTRLDPDLTFGGRARALARALGVPSDHPLRLALPDSLSTWGRMQLPKSTLAIIPGSVWFTKRWPAAHGGRLAAQLVQRGYEVIVLGSSAERALCQEVATAGGPGCQNLAGTTLEQALGLLSACRAVVGGDSGLTHAARALGLPVVTLFGPTSSAHHDEGARDRFVSLGLSCSPCSAHGGRRCPLGHHDCLQKLRPEVVAERLLPLIDSSGQGGTTG